MEVTNSAPSSPLQNMSVPERTKDIKLLLDLVDEPQSAHKAGPLHKKCEVCEKHIYCKQFIGHMAMHNEGKHYLGKESMKCAWCDENFSTAFIELHAMGKHSYGNFLCGKCSFGCNFAKDLIDHIAEDHEEEQSAVCPRCKKGNPLTELENHYKLCIQTTGNRSGPWNPLHKECEICGKGVYCENYKQHMLRHDKHGTFYMKCVWCQEKFTTGYYHRHAFVQHFYGNFSCEKCLFKGNFAKELIEHLTNDHMEEQFAKCPSCKKGISLEDLESHYKTCIRKKIRGLCSHVCDKCGKTITTKSEYVKHLKTHLRKEVDNQGHSSHYKLYYYCDKCGRKFASTSKLRYHIESVHENVTYPCSSCPETFTTYHLCKMHEIKVHSTDEKYQCKYCGKREASIQKVKRHEQVHEDPQFSCKFCQKKLKTPEALEAHERHHTGVTPFKCPVCDKGFVSRGALGQHVRGAHKIKAENELCLMRYRRLQKRKKLPTAPSVPRQSVRFPRHLTTFDRSQL